MNWTTMWAAIAHFSTASRLLRAGRLSWPERKQYGPKPTDMEREQDWRAQERQRGPRR
jgi:hypothetical protein